MAIQITSPITGKKATIGDITPKQQLYLLQSTDLYDSLTQIGKPLLAEFLKPFLFQPNLIIKEI